MKIVTFSGIDGAGKSTQILELKAWLRQARMRTRLLTFWDDVVVLSRFREFLSQKAFKGDQGVGSPERPLHRRDKNITSWPATVARFFLYFADAVNVWRQVRESKRRNVDVVVFDRYIYDELANLPLNNPLARAFAWLTLQLAPQPDVAFVIDADPEAACARKPEYPLEFLRHNREAYLDLARLAGNITVLEPDSVQITATRIRNEMLETLFGTEEKLPALPVLQ